ncbi:MAG: hypothetical protein E7019_02865 [Alphaproteobacteria bacterium]|nr:hypothetical protein [Alphaproteobacteria bacterium]
MCRFLSWCFGLLLIIMPIRFASAQASDITTYEMFGIPDEVIKVIEAPKIEEKKVDIDFPSCNDENIQQQVKQHLSSIDKDEYINVINYRKQKLALKNIKNFTEVGMTAFRPSQNYLLAEEIFNLRNKKKLSKYAIKVCSSFNVNSERSLYIIMYEDKRDMKVILLSESYKTEFTVLGQNLQK